MYREWGDPRDGKVWLVQVFYGTSEDAFGRPRAVPRMITYRRPLDVELPAEHVHSVPMDGAAQLHELTDQELASLLDQARSLGRVEAPPAEADGPPRMRMDWMDARDGRIWRIAMVRVPSEHALVVFSGEGVELSARVAWDVKSVRELTRDDLRALLDAARARP